MIRLYRYYWQYWFKRCLPWMKISTTSSSHCKAMVMTFICVCIVYDAELLTVWNNMNKLGSMFKESNDWYIFFIKRNSCLFGYVCTYMSICIQEIEKGNIPGSLLLGLEALYVFRYDDDLDTMILLRAEIFPYKTDTEN